MPIFILYLCTCYNTFLHVLHVALKSSVSISNGVSTSNDISTSNRGGKLYPQVRH